MLSELPEGKEVAAIRLQIDGNWTVQDFHALLENIRDIYQRLASIMVLGEFLKEEERRAAQEPASQDWFWSHLYEGPQFYARPDFEPWFERWSEYLPLHQVSGVVQPFI